MLHRRLAASTFTILGFAVAAAAQCQPQWLVGEPRPTPSGFVRASTLWDPDGAGPLTTVLVVAGGLAVATATEAPVATYDGTQWTVLGSLPGTATALTVHNGQLHAATVYTFVVFGIPQTAYGVHVWDGAAWQPLGTPTGPVHAMKSHGGQLVVGGSFSVVNGVAAANVAAWTGSAWTALGSGVQGEVRAMTSFGSSLWVGGNLSSAGGTPVGNLAIWGTAGWSAGPSFNGTVETFAVRESTAISSTYLFVGGAFTQLTQGGVLAVNRLARMNAFSLQWDAVNGGVPGTRCKSLLVRSVGLNSYELAAGVEDAASTQRVWRLASGGWSALGTLTDSLGSVYANALSFYGGRWVAALNNSSVAVRSFDGAAWQGIVGRGIAGTVYAAEPVGSDVVIGGTFTTISGVVVNNIARGGPGSWSPLGSGVEVGQGVFALARAANGDVIAAGDFTIAGGVACNRIARWNGAVWAPLGSGLDAPAHALLVLANGDLIAAGDFTTAGGIACSRIARWSGGAWSPLGTGVNTRVYELEALADGSIVAAGNFLVAGGVPCNRIARWNGSTWGPLGSGCDNSVYALATAPNGDLYAAGVFTTAGGLATRIGKWSNGAWSQVISLGINAEVYALAVHGNGDLFVGGNVFSFSLGPFGGWTSNMVRIGNGGGSLSPMSVHGVTVYDASIAQGELVIGGSFTTAGGIVSTNFARLDAPCPAAALPFGASCAGLTAPFALAAIDAPWVGGAWRLRASTFGPSSFAFRAIGFSAFPGPIALGPVLPGALPGCFGHVPADVAEVHFPVGGAVTVSTAVPLNSALAGVELFEQMLQFEPAGGGALAISASNAVELVIGAY